MKAKSGFKGLDSFSLSFSTKSSELLKLPGNDVKMGAIHELFDSGKDEEARKLLRRALADISQNLDTILADDGKTRGGSDQAEPILTAALLPSM